MDGVIVLDDEMHLLVEAHQQLKNYTGLPSSSSSSRRVSNSGQPAQNAQHGRGTKRTRNGSRVLHAADMIPQFATTPEPSAVSLTSQTDTAPSIIVAGQNIFYIQEVQDGNDQAVLVSDDEPEVQYMQPNIITPLYTNGSDTDDALDLDDVELQLAEADEYNKVDPLELSDIWNDLITANQEILILLELSDLKHHIADARKIEVQMRDMACEYCGRVFPDIQSWDRHVRKIHFQTELFECDSCDGKFKYFARFKDHLNGHNGKRIYGCDECDHHYAFRIGFLVHKILDHMKLNGIYVCPKCDLDCRDAQNYKLHIASHIEFGPRSGSAVQPVSAKVASSVAARSNLKNSQKNKPTETTTVNPQFFAKETEQNKFLNVFESFSKTRKVAQTHRVSTKKKKH